MVVSRDADERALGCFIDRLGRWEKHLLRTGTPDRLPAPKKADEVTDHCVRQSLGGFDEQRPGRLVEKEIDLWHSGLHFRHENR